MTSWTGTLFYTAAAAASVYCVVNTVLPQLQTKQSSEDGAQLEELDLDEGEYITAEDVIAVFNDLFLQMQAVLAQLSQQIQQIQMSGQSIPETELRKLLTAEFERALLMKQKESFDKHGLDEECIAKATWEFLDDPEQYPRVKASVERFQKLYENVSGKTVVGKRPGDARRSAKKAPSGGTSSSPPAETLSKEKLLEVAEVYFDALTDAMKEIVDRFKSENKDLRDRAVAQSLHMEFASVANDRGEEALKKAGVSLEGFRAAIEKNSSDPEVGRTLSLLQMKQQQQIVAMGVPGM